MKNFPQAKHQEWLDQIGYDNTVCEQCETDTEDPYLLDENNLCEDCQDKEND